MTLGDAFNRRKKLSADLQSWIARLGLAGTERRTYRTSALDGDTAYRPDPGTEKASTRQYTVQECRDRIPKLERAARDVPLRADDVSVYDSGDDWVRYRLVKKVERKKETFSDKGLKVEEIALLGHDVVEVTDY